MSEKYTYDDIIINPRDPRLKIGAEYYCGNNPRDLIFATRRGDTSCLARLQRADNLMSRPFIAEDCHYTCLIRKKVDFVPFDLSEERDRARLRGTWVRDKKYGVERVIDQIREDTVHIAGEGELPPEDLLIHYEFLDGSSCGKEVEE